MARTTTKQPAKKQPADKSATQSERKADVITVKVLAERLNTTEKALRTRIRKINGGTLPEGVSRYEWPSMNDPSLKELLKALEGSKSES